MIQFQCDSCQKYLKIPDTYIGQEVKCSVCGAVVTVVEVARIKIPSGWLSDHFGFRTFIYPTCIKILYVLIVLVWLGFTIYAFSQGGFEGFGVLLGGGLLLFFTRIVFEFLIVTFRNYEENRDMHEELRRHHIVIETKKN